MITLPIWVFIILCVCAFIDVLELIIFLWAIISIEIEERKEAKRADEVEKLKKSIHIANVMNPDINPEYIPKDLRTMSHGDYPREGE